VQRRRVEALLRRLRLVLVLAKVQEMRLVSQVEAE